MPTDHELLTLAAKAAGITIVRSRLDDPLNLDMLVERSVRNPYQNTGPWNPLADDGDALRLAMKLRMDVNTGTSHSVASWYDPHTEPHNRSAGPERHADHASPDAATRRAIVRTAAEIGRNTK